MSKIYGKMMDDAFLEYYERFRELNALSKETAVSPKELFPGGQSLIDSDRMHKMLSAGIVKRVGLNRYWLDEKRADDSDGVFKQRIMIIAIALVLGLVLGLLRKYGIINL